MQGLTDLDILQLVKYSYMDLSNKDDYNGYVSDKNILINNKTRIGDTAVFFERGMLNRSQTHGMAKGQDLARKKKVRVRFNFEKVIEEVRRNENLKNLILIGHENDNVMTGNEKGTGLVVFAFKNYATNEIYFVCRGSEGEMFDFVGDWVDKIKQRKWTEIFKSEDWRDNFNMIFGSSSNFAPLVSFVKDIKAKYGDSKTKYSAFGHSKGGGLAIYLASYFDNMGGASIDGIGLPMEVALENRNYKARLQAANFSNKVAENDIVGRLLVHYEKVETLKMNRRFEDENGVLVNPFDFEGFVWSHYPDAIFINELLMGVVSNAKHIMPTIMDVINKFIMLGVRHEELPKLEKATHKDFITAMEEKCITFLDGLLDDHQKKQ